MWSVGVIMFLLVCGKVQYVLFCYVVFNRYTNWHRNINNA